MLYHSLNIQEPYSNFQKVYLMKNEKNSLNYLRENLQLLNN